MTLPIPPLLKTILDSGGITCPKCRRPMDELDYAGEAVDEDGAHIRFHCRICFPPSQPN